MQFNSKILAAKLFKCEIYFLKTNLLKLLTSIFILFMNVAVFAHGVRDSTLQNKSDNVVQKRNSINIYVISKDKYFDLTNRIIVWQTRLTALLHSKKLKIILATSTADAEKKIAALVNKHHYTINTLWLDSHGKYRKGYSSFMIGTDEYSYKNISDSDHLIQIKKIASYCNSNTKIGLGACYVAADFNFPVLKNGAYQNMFGDSLLRGMAKIFKDSEVYGCKSWVMAKPWILGSKNALAGYPLDRQYKDTIFLPVWKCMGEWKRYSTTSQHVEIINTIYLSNKGDILIQDEPYMSQKKAHRKMERNLKKLRRGLYDLSKPV